ncbi:hypothetical protein HPB50_018649 [Hyalomma asiaticum]|uniref:Uncharacterized protein n=1 Tax=Hyalomma asiaticum TaxID=266040 RepID=A0ACB7T014_HYAAI|nr:hypothetical protein HPB50_018649 [Hyalomma asiaticum]
MSTACQERVVKYAQIRHVTLQGKKIKIRSYITRPDRAVQGTIYRAYNRESRQEILRKLWLSNLLLPFVQARDIGRASKPVLMHFFLRGSPSRSSFLAQSLESTP